MANFYDAFAQGQANGLERQRAITQRNQLAELQQLGPQVIGGDLAATDRAYALDPQRAQAFQAEGNRQQQQLFGLAKSLKQSAANPQMQAGIYRSAIPFLKRSFGVQIPDEFDAASVMPIVDQVLAVAENAPSMAGVGGNLLSQRVGDDGFIYNTFRDGRMVNTGVKADRQAWFRDQPGFEPEIVNKDGSVRSLGSTGGAMAPSPAGQGVQVGSGVGAVRMNIEGIPAAQQQRMAQTVSLMQQAGYPEEEIAGFVQSQLPPDMPGLPQAGSAPMQPTSRARPTAGQEAAEAERARTAVRNENFGIDLEQERLRKEQEARIEAEKTRAVEQAKSQQERASVARAKSAALNNVDRGIDRMERALKSLNRGLVSDTGPVDSFVSRWTKEGDELTAAIGSVQDSMLALTRVPGVGSQSDLEARMANLKYPGLSNYPATNQNNLAQLRAFVEDLRTQFGGDPSNGIPPSGGQPPEQGQSIDALLEKYR